MWAVLFELQLISWTLSFADDQKDFLYVINLISRELTEGKTSRQGVHVISYPEADQIRPFPLHSRHEASGTVWRAWLWIGPAGMVIECLRHVRFDIWKREWLAFVCAPGLALALHVSCRAARRKGRKRKVYISAQTDEHRLLECIWDGGGSNPAGGLLHCFNDVGSPQWFPCLLWIKVLHKCCCVGFGFIFYWFT